METLRDFLLERILDDETVAQEAIDSHRIDHTWTGAAGADGEHFARWNPWRVLTACVAKRLIIAAHRDVGPGIDRRASLDRTVKFHACSTCGQYDEYAIEWPCYTLKVLALDWVDHPAYRQEWRPQRLSSGVGRAPAASAMPTPDQESTRRTAASVPAATTGTPGVVPAATSPAATGPLPVPPRQRPGSSTGWTQSA